MKSGKWKAVTFDVTDTVLLEIDSQLALITGAGKGESAGLDVDFGSALGEENLSLPSSTERIKR